MPAAAKGITGRGGIFETLDRTKAHFIVPSSPSGSDSERDIEGEGQLEDEHIELSLTGFDGGESKARSRSGSQQAVTSEAFASHPESEGKMSMRYSRVATSDGNSSPITEAEHAKRRRSQLAEKISNKLHALFWALVGLGVAYQTDFLRVLMEDERVNRWWFDLGAVCFGINVVIMLYLTVWLPHIKGIRVSWNVYSPRAIPTATVVGLVCAVALNAALWRIWGFLTPLILFAVFIGCLFSLHFVPWPC